MPNFSNIGYLANFEAVPSTMCSDLPLLVSLENSIFRDKSLPRDCEQIYVTVLTLNMNLASALQPHAILK